MIEFEINTNKKQIDFDITQGIPKYTPANFQSKTVIPTTEQQIIRADIPYDGLEQVTVEPISGDANQKILCWVDEYHENGTAKKIRSINMEVIPPYAYSYSENTNSAFLRDIEEIDLNEGVKIIQGSEWYYKSSLKKIIYPTTIEEIWYQAPTKGCSATENNIYYATDRSGRKFLLTSTSTLSQITVIPEVKIINGYGTGSYLTTITFSNSPIFIGGYAFSNCRNKLKTLNNTGHIKKIGVYAFSSCTQLENLSFDGVIQLYSGAFSQCTKLKTISIPNCIEIGSRGFYSDKLLTTVDCPKLEVIGSEAFYDCNELQNIDLNNVKKIESNAFYGTKIVDFYLPNCEEIIQLPKTAKSLYAPNVKKIASLFYYNNTLTNLKDVYLGENVTQLNSDFYQCTALTEITKDDLIYIKILNGQTFRGCSTLRSVDMPSIEEIKSSYTFLDCTSLQSVKMENLKRLDYGCFDGCTSLRNITIPKLEEIVGSINFSGTAIEELYLPNLIKVMGSAFSGMKKLKTLTIPKLKYIPSNFCSNDTLLETVVGDKIEFIQSSAFDNCTSFKNINLSNIDYFGLDSYAFRNSGIEEVYIPLWGGMYKSPNYTGSPSRTYYVFYGCQNLKKAKFDNIQTIGQYLFYNCTALEILDLSNVKGVPTLDNSALTNTPTTMKIIIPDNLYNSFLTATNWNAYSNRFVKASEYTEA